VATSGLAKSVDIWADWLPPEVATTWAAFPAVTLKEFEVADFSVPLVAVSR